MEQSVCNYDIYSGPIEIHACVYLPDIQVHTGEQMNVPVCVYTRMYVCV